MEVFPRTIYERVFSVVVLVFALLVFSSFVSSITTSMTQLRNLSNMFDRNVSLLRRYLKYRQIPHDLSMRVLRYVEHQLSLRKQEIQENDVALLRLLSKPLQMELVQRTFEPTLCQHPFYRCFADTDPHAMKHACNSAVACLLLSAGDTLFTDGSRGKRMFFLVKGRLRYHDGTYPSTGNVHELGKGSWCCEGALWTKWVHLGTMTADTDAELLSVESAELAAITSGHEKVVRATYLYGRAYVAYLNSQADAGHPLSDLPTMSNENSQENLLAQEAFPDTFTLTGSQMASRRSTSVISASSTIVVESKTCCAFLYHKLLECRGSVAPTVDCLTSPQGPSTSASSPGLVSPTGPTTSTQRESAELTGCQGDNTKSHIEL
jgi:CRP-like cAMP-binding protein